LGASPVFVDIRPDTYNIDPQKISPRITPRTKAVLPVDIFGQPADMAEISSVAVSHGLAVVEDAAQSLGALYGGRKAGALALVGCTSFFPSKPLGCYGDGGAVFSDDDVLAAAARVIMNHGQTERYVHARIGLNARMDTIQAAVLLAKLPGFAEEIRQRAIVAARYRDGLRDVEQVVLPEVLPDRTSVYAQFSLLVPDREEFIRRMGEQGIPTAVHYPIPLYRQGALAHQGVDPSEYPVTEDVCARVVSLPMSAYLTAEDQATIIAAIRKHYGH
jgi:UDP-2-acetamido-2-deoxy-ribo-hexuluronate aminotransferase